MTPREKAEKLVSKYYIICQEFTEEIQCSIQAKQCAFIAVHELIDQCWSYREIDLGMSLDYWEEVKKEIESYEAVL